MDRETGFVALTDRFDECLAARGSGVGLGGPPKAREGDRRPGRPASRLRLRPGEERHRTQHRVRADLDDCVDSERGQRLGAGAERDRLARLPPPVGGVERLVRLHHPAR